MKYLKTVFSVCFSSLALNDFGRGIFLHDSADGFGKSPCALPDKGELKQKHSQELCEPSETVNDPFWFLFWFGFLLLQGAKALALSLMVDTSIFTLDLSDNWLQGEGAAAVAEMLKENCYISGLYSLVCRSLVDRGGNCADFFVDLTSPAVIVTLCV